MMSWLPIAVLAQVIIGSSAVFDKLLLRERSVAPWPYAFWFGVLGLAAFLLLPFGYARTPGPLVLLALLGGAAFIGSAYYYFLALETIEASEALPLLGALSPIATLTLSSWLLGSELGRLDLLGFGFLIAAGVLLYLFERRDFRPRIILTIGAAALLLAFSHVASKAVFQGTSFITGFFWVKMGGVLLVVLLLASDRLRREIRASLGRVSVRNRWFYSGNRTYAALGSLLISGAIFLSEPALVDATQNIRYVVIFALAWLLLRERFRGRYLTGKVLAVIFVSFGLATLALAEYARTLPSVHAERPIRWGVTFSHKFSSEIGLDWQENFRAILDELQPGGLRLIAYWDEIESEAGRFKFDDLDWQVTMAEERGTPYILALGLKTPRWPECHIPSWARELGRADEESALQEYIRAVVVRYRDQPGLTYWQVENEPLLWFGQCPSRGEGFLSREIAFVRELDPENPILVTDGGEIGDWARVAHYGDAFGTTMYRKVYPRFIGPVFGHIEYPLSPAYFRVKEHLVRWWNQTPVQRFIVIELQAEPWEPQSLATVPYAQLVKDFSPEYFRDTIEYAKATGFEEYYFWGAEWWYWMGVTHGDWRYWYIARDVLQGL